MNWADEPRRGSKLRKSIPDEPARKAVKRFRVQQASSIIYWKIETGVDKVSQPMTADRKLKVVVVQPFDYVGD